MPNNVTDVDTFTDPIQYPADGEAIDQVSEAIPAQGLANRTRNNKNRIDAIETAATGVGCTIGVTGTAVADNLQTGFSLTVRKDFGGFSIIGGEIAVPKNGLYLINIGLYLETDSTSNPEYFSSLGVAQWTAPASTIVQALGARFSTTTTDSIWVSGHGVARVTDYTDAAQRFSVYHTAGGELVTIGTRGAFDMITFSRIGD